MGVKGVKAINNKITLKPKENRPDSEIRQDIAQSLRCDILIDDALIEVDVKHGKVELSGTVGSLVEKHRAIDTAHVANVESVDARNLAVRWWTRDPQLRGKITENEQMPKW
jgi:osmotically-inducible protein OsmY